MIHSKEDLSVVMKELYGLGNLLLSVLRVEAQAVKKGCFDDLQPLEVDQFNQNMQFLIDLAPFTDDGKSRRVRKFRSDASNGSRDGGRGPRSNG